MRSGRIVWIDNMKCICMLLVMLSHLRSGAAIPLALYEPVFLTGFLFAAGYVYRHENFSVFLEKKVRGLLIPWLIFSVGNLLLSQLVSFQPHGSLREELFWNFLQIRGKGDGVWFVAALFLSFLPFYGLAGWYEKSRRKGKALWLLGSTFLLSLLSLLYTRWMDPSLLPWNSTALPWHLEYVFQAVFFMTLGYLSRQTEKEISGISAGTLYGFCLLPGVLHWKLPLAAEVLVTHAAGITGVFALAHLCRKLPQNRFAARIGGNTLVCFALHGKVMSLLEWMLQRFLPEGYAAMLGHGLFSSLLAAVLTLLMALVLLIPIEIIDRWFPFLLGRKRRN